MQRDEEKKETQAKEANQEKIKYADKKLLGTAREPMEDGAYIKLLGAQGKFSFEEFWIVPATNWSNKNALFDGLKYCGPVMQNPYNPLNMER